MGSANTSNLDALTKVLYPNGIGFVKLRKSALFMKCNKDTKFGGKNREIKLTVSDGTGGSSTFANALANRGPGQHVTFTLTRKKDYVIGSLENEVIMATQNDNHAVLEALKSELELKSNEMGERLVRRFMGDEGGHLGIISSISGSTIILTRQADMRHHRVGKIISLADDNGTGTSPSAGRAGSLTITGVDFATKTLTFSEAVTTGIPAAEAGDYLFHPGDYGLSPTGVLGWCPITKPSTSFLNVDRSLYPDLTGGFRYAANAGGSMIETINNGLAYSAEFQTADERLGLCEYTDFARLQNELEGRAMTRTNSGRGKFAEVSWKELVVNTPAGEVGFRAEPGVPQGYCIVTDPADWTVHSLGELPHYSEEKLQQESAADARQFRMRAFWNVGNKAPYNTTILTW